MAEKNLLNIEMTVDFGQDVGQNFGALFEARNDAGRTVFGAGFAGDYNTRFRTDRHTLQFFIRPDSSKRTFAIQRMPRPTIDGGSYIFDFEGKVYSRSHYKDGVFRYWDEKSKAWKDDGDFDARRMRHGDGRMRLAGKILEFMDNQVTYDGRQILAPPEIGIYHGFFYANGHLVFYHWNRSNENGFTKLYACPWTPLDAGPIDLNEAHILPLTYVGETPFAFGQFHQEILTCSNMGGVYVFDGQKWRAQVKPLKGTSYQVYSMINYYDKLLFAQYPTGHLLEYDGKTIVEHKGWPPVLPGVSTRAREAQSTMIYAGDLWVGVWPWAELWRYDRDADQWHSMGRMFTLPELTDKVNHPYEQEILDYCKKHNAKIVYNNWGQRLTSMAPFRTDLILATCAKGPWRRDPRLDFISEKAWLEYGQPHRLHMPGNLAVTTDWKDGPIHLRFTITKSRIVIEQDGKVLGRASMPAELASLVSGANIEWGKGIFGPLRAAILDKNAR